MSPLKRKKDIDILTADSILQNVYKSCNAEPNRISLEEISDKTGSDRRFDSILLIISGVFLVLTLISPLLFKSSQAFVSVDSKSKRTLSITEHEMSTTAFSLSFEGPLIDTSKTFIETEKGTIIFPSSYDRNTNTIVFSPLSYEANIYIYDINGNCLHLLFSPHR